MDTYDYALMDEAGEIVEQGEFVSDFPWKIGDVRDFAGTEWALDRIDPPLSKSAKAHLIFRRA